MNIIRHAHIASKIIGAKFFKKRFPLVVSLSLTAKCNLRCGYCGYPRKEFKELDTEKIISLIGELADLGTSYLIFSGGEALLKNGSGEIINYASSRNIYTILNSNGTLVRERIEELSGLDEIQLSLDGPREIHDSIRGKENTYEKVIDAAKICKNKGIKVYFISVLSSSNLDSYRFVLDLANSLKAGVYFQPATKNVLGEKKENQLAASPEKYRQTVRRIIKEKQKGNRAISNSLKGLEHLSRWPEPNYMNCLIKLLHCYVEPDGRMFSCDRFPDYENFLLPLDGDFNGIFNKIYTPECSSCWCATKADFNLAGNMDLGAIFSMRRRLGKQ